MSGGDPDSTTATVYGASPIKRRHRASHDEMEVRADFLIAYARQHKPVTVRQLFYAATVANLPGVDKDERGYVKVQRQVLALRRAGRLPYSAIADSTRWMRKPRSYDNLVDALNETARHYRRNLWRDHADNVEVWIEKDALAGAIHPVTAEYDVPLMVCKGFSSETFAYEAAAAYAASGKPVTVYHLGDFDRSGVDASVDLENKLTNFASEHGVEVTFKSLAVTPEQIQELRLPTRPHKRKAAADKAWPVSFACELDAIPPDTLRQIVRDALGTHMPDSLLREIRVAEESERELLEIFALRAEDAA